MDYSKFFQKYWWLRSPGTDNNGVVWNVDPDGDVYLYYFYVTNSYGRDISPCTEFTNDAWHANPSGVVYDYRNVDLSYGSISPVTKYSSNAWSVTSGGVADYIGNYFDHVNDSYGNLTR